MFPAAINKTDLHGTAQRIDSYIPKSSTFKYQITYCVKYILFNLSIFGEGVFPVEL